MYLISGAYGCIKGLTLILGINTNFPAPQSGSSLAFISDILECAVSERLVHARYSGHGSIANDKA